MKAPKQLWWVEFKSNGTKRDVARVGYRHHGAPKGGKFSSLAAAQERKADVLRQWPGATVTIYGSGIIRWTDTGV